MFQLCFFDPNQITYLCSHHPPSPLKEIACAGNLYLNTFREIWAACAVAPPRCNNNLPYFIGMKLEMWLHNPLHGMVDIPNATGWLRAVPLNHYSHQHHSLLSGILPYVRRSCIPLLSKLPSSSNQFTHTQTFHPSGTLRGIMNLHRKLLVLRSQILVVFETPVQQILEVLLPQPKWLLKWGQWPITTRWNSSPPPSGWVVPLPNRIARCTAPCSFITIR